MELRSTIKLSCTWNTSISNESENILYIKKNSGIIIDQPLQHTEDSEPIKLHRPSSEEGEGAPSCYICIDVSQLRGYFVTGIEMVSSSRTIEYYNGRRPNEEYVGTNRGTLVEQSDNGGCKLYKCVFESSGIIQTDVTLKLVSLHNCESGYLTQICLIVTENMGGEETKEAEKEENNRLNFTPNDLQELISKKSVNNDSEHGGLPVPLLPKLLATLQQLQHAQTTTRTEMDQMVSFFRQMRPNLHNEKTATPPQQENEKEDDTTSVNNDSTVVTVKEDILLASVNKETEYLEQRLKEYIDVKIATLQDKMETRLQEIYDELMMKINSLNYNDSNT